MVFFAFLKALVYYFLLDMCSNYTSRGAKLRKLCSLSLVYTQRDPAYVAVLFRVDVCKKHEPSIVG